ncbi:RASEF protein, partial [Balaeniceps rex]|nr:RASEF protein [Balaeniceps rex]
DTPGPRYQRIAQSYFHKAHSTLFLYEISSQSSFLSICQWIEDIKVGEGSDRHPGPTERGRSLGASSGRAGLCCAPGSLWEAGTRQEQAGLLAKQGAGTAPGS